MPEWGEGGADEREDRPTGDDDDDDYGGGRPRVRQTGLDGAGEG